MRPEEGGTVGSASTSIGLFTGEDIAAQVQELEKRVAQQVCEAQFLSRWLAASTIHKQQGGRDYTEHVEVLCCSNTTSLETVVGCKFTPPAYVPSR